MPLPIVPTGRDFDVGYWTDNFKAHDERDPLEKLLIRRRHLEQLLPIDFTAR